MKESETLQPQVFEVVCEYRRLGINVFGLVTDGSRCPIGQWKPYQTERVPGFLIREHFDRRNPCGIMGICGVTSGDLEVLDFDDITVWKPFARRLAKTYSGLFGYAPFVETPSGGRHLYYRCDEIEGNLKLAYDDGSPPKIRIETRGQGGMVVMPGSPLGTHRLGKPYRLIAGNWSKIPRITPVQRRVVLDIAREFDLSPPKPKKIDLATVYPQMPRSFHGNGLTPWEDYDARGPGWEDILGAAGWRVDRSSGETTYWKRPGKEGPGCSASTGHCGDLLHVFSSNAHPFEAGGTYSKSAATCLLHFAGDWSHCARSLAALGFGDIDDTEERLKEIIG